MIGMTIWGLLNAILYFKNFSAFKDTTIMLNELAPQKKGIKSKKNKKGKSSKKNQAPVEESKEEVHFERADEENQV